METGNVKILSSPMAAAPLFEDWDEKIVLSCLQSVMGNIYADSEENPSSAAAVMGDFCFFAGQPSECLVRYDYEKDFLIMVPRSEAWSELIVSVYKEQAKRRMRYAIKKEPDCFNKEVLLSYVHSLKPSCSLKKIDREIYERCFENDWSRDLVSQFQTYEMYEALAVGIVVVKDGCILSGASTYARYREGIEIEIDTRQDCRRRGFALAAGAALILECLDRGLYPSWDAHNPGSVALAQKLGYTFDFEYPVYEVYKKAVGKNL